MKVYPGYLDLLAVVAVVVVGGVVVVISAAVSAAVVATVMVVKLGVTKNPLECDLFMLLGT